MSMTDPIADLLTRIRNAQAAGHTTVDAPASRMKASILGILKEEGYITEYEEIPDDRQGSLRVTLKYGPGGAHTISGLERVSKPGRRIYRGKNDIPKVLGGLGVTILSTPKGVMTGGECRKQGVGGEVLISVW